MVTFIVKKKLEDKGFVCELREDDYRTGGIFHNDRLLWMLTNLMVQYLLLGFHFPNQTTFFSSNVDGDSTTPYSGKERFLSEAWAKHRGHDLVPLIDY